MKILKIDLTPEQLKNKLYPVATKHNLSVSYYQVSIFKDKDLSPKEAVIFEIYSKEDTKFSILIPTNVVLENNQELVLLIKCGNKLSLLEKYQDIKVQINKIIEGIR